MGDMTEGGPAGTYFSDGNQGALGRGVERCVFAELTNGENNFPLGLDCGAYTNCSRFLAVAAPQPQSTTWHEIGLFLVRKETAESAPVEVPEPSSLALLCACALVAFQRRKKNS